MRLVVGFALVLAFAAALWMATLRETAVSCEVCLDFDGASVCRSGVGADRSAALQSARSTACAVLANGVTRGMRCQRTPARSEVCGPEAARSPGEGR